MQLRMVKGVDRYIIFLSAEKERAAVVEYAYFWKKATTAQKLQDKSILLRNTKMQFNGTLSYRDRKMLKMS